MRVVLCITAQTGPRGSDRIVHSLGAGALRHVHMLVIFAVLITATAVWSLRRGVPGDGPSRNLGWMSEQWLSELRAGHTP
jgi:hypothetical protein